MDFSIDFKMNHGFFVLHELLEPLRPSFFGQLTDDVNEELEKFNDILLKYLNIHDPNCKDVDLDSVEYFMRYQYILKSKKSKNQYAIFTIFYQEILVASRTCVTISIFCVKLYLCGGENTN